MSNVAERYPVEVLGEDDDNGTMVDNVETLAEQVVGHRIVSVEQNAEIPRERRSYFGSSHGLRITLDNGKSVFLADGGDCCAYTELHTFLLNPDLVDHVITGIGTTDGYSTWHIYADAGDVLALTLGWSPGNPFYYGYGFDISVYDAEVVDE